MANIEVEVTMPDSFYRMIEEKHHDISLYKPSGPEMTAAFQEIINLLGGLLASLYRPDTDHVMYFKDMDANIATFGHDRKRTPEAEAIGKDFLVLLRDLTQTPRYQELIEEENRRGDDHPHADPGGGMRSPGAYDDDDDDDERR